MNIAEKLSTIANNVSKVYNAGYEQGKADGGGGVLWNDICKEVYDIEKMFLGATFAEDFELVLELNKLNSGTTVNSLRNAFQNTTVGKIVLKSSQTEMANTFNQTFSKSTMKELDLSEFDVYLHNAVQAFQNCTNLEEVKGILKFHSTIKYASNMFTNCPKLTEVRFAKDTITVSVQFANSSLLSADSIQSIIDGLATVETAQTLTLHATVKAKLTEEQLTTITSKNWTLA